MSDTTPHAPSVSHCPYCGDRAEAEVWVDVQDETEPTFAAGGAPDLSEATTWDYTRCARILPCGHVFEKESIDAILDALKELRSLKAERRQCENADALKRLDYEIEAQVHAVNNRAHEATRRPEAEDND